MSWTQPGQCLWAEHVERRFPSFLLSQSSLLFAVDGKSMKSMTLLSSVPKCLWTLKRPPVKRATQPCLRPIIRKSTCDHKTVLRAPSVTFTAALVSRTATPAHLQPLELPSAKGSPDCDGRKIHILVQCACTGDKMQNDSYGYQLDM